MKFVPVPGTKVQFCIWETRVKDYAAGKIKAGQKYRLPTDAEWSVAVG